MPSFTEARIKYAAYIFRKVTHRTSTIKKKGGERRLKNYCRIQVHPGRSIGAGTRYCACQGAWRQIAHFSCAVLSAARAGRIGQKLIEIEEKIKHSFEREVKPHVNGFSILGFFIP